MKKDTKKILLSDAREIAESSARRNLSCFLMKEDTEILDNVFLEAEYCWMFFRSKTISVPPEGQLRADWAYVVSKDGQVREVPDYSDDPSQLKEYLETMSEYFKRRIKGDRFI